MFEFGEKKEQKLSIRISEKDKNRLEYLTKKYKLSQGEVMIRAFRAAYEADRKTEIELK